MPTENLSRRHALTLLAIVVLAWGFTWVVSKLLLQYMTPIWACLLYTSPSPRD